MVCCNNVPVVVTGSSVSTNLRKLLELNTRLAEGRANLNNMQSDDTQVVAAVRPCSDKRLAGWFKPCRTDAAPHLPINNSPDIIFAMQTVQYAIWMTTLVPHELIACGVLLFDMLIPPPGGHACHVSRDLGHVRMTCDNRVHAG